MSLSKLVVCTLGAAQFASEHVVPALLTKTRLAYWCTLAKRCSCVLEGSTVDQSLRISTMQQSVAPRTRPVTGNRSLRPVAFTSHRLPLKACRQGVVAVRAQGANDDADFEARLAALKTGKGETPYGKSSSVGGSSSGSKKPAAAGSRKVYDYTDETVYYESGPHLGDLAVNLALGATLIWLPLSVAAAGRSAFVKYRFTDRRLSCITTAPWKNEQLDAAYQEVKDVVAIGRGIGLWGDMVVTLQNGDKIEMRAIPRHIELKEYILRRRDELKGGNQEQKAAKVDRKGFA